MHIAVVEDRKEDRDLLLELLKKYELENDCRFQVTCYGDGMSLLDEYQAIFDIVMMDIEMPGMDGMEAAKKLRELDSSTCLIFITNLAQYAIRGYEVDAMDFLVKPLQYFPFSLHLKKAIHACGLWKQRYIGVDTPKGIVKVPLEHLYYVESEKHYLVSHTQSGDLRSRGTIKDMLEELPKESFARCHASFIVNLNYVERVGRSGVLIHGATLPVSRSCYKDLMDAFARYLGGRRGW